MKSFHAYLIAAMSLPSSYALGTETLKSPYFIDGVHCEGLQDKDRDKTIGEVFADDEVAKLGVKAQNQIFCEQIFSKHGIQKFQWVTPDDLEKLTFGLKRSGKYKNIDVRIEKSELQNHVHLTIKFEQFEPRNYFSVNVSSGSDKGSATGSRQTTTADLLFQYQKRGAENPAMFDLGLHTINSSAPSPLSVEEIKKGNKDVVLDTSETLAQSKQNWAYTEVFYKVPLLQGNPSFPIDFKLGLNKSRLSKDEVSDVNTNFELSSSYKPDELVPLKYKFSLLYSTYSATGAQSIIRKKDEEEDKNQKRKDVHIVFAGIRQDFKARFLSFYLNFNRSLTSELHYFYNYDIRLRLSELGGIVGSLGFSEDMVYGAILPEHRFGLPNRSLFDIYLLAEKDFRAFESDNKVTFKGGARHLASDRNASRGGYSRDQGFAEIGIKSRLDNVDVGLSFIYGSQRLY
jgi:hypothetical protein